MQTGRSKRWSHVLNIAFFGCQLQRGSSARQPRLDPAGADRCILEPTSGAGNHANILLAGGGSFGTCVEARARSKRLQSALQVLQDLPRVTPSACNFNKHEPTPPPHQPKSILRLITPEFYLTQPHMSSARARYRRGLKKNVGSPITPPPAHRPTRGLAGVRGVARAPQAGAGRGLGCIHRPTRYPEDAVIDDLELFRSRLTLVTVLQTPKAAQGTYMCAHLLFEVVEALGDALHECV